MQGNELITKFPPHKLGTQVATTQIITTTNSRKAVGAGASGMARLEVGSANGSRRWISRARPISDKIELNGVLPGVTMVKGSGAARRAFLKS